jgi:hypothetical protein
VIAVTPLRDWLSRPVTWVTLLVTLLGSAMLIAASPWGAGASDGLIMWIAFAWFGIFFAQLISLGAWAALRDGRWVSRISPPVALLVIHILATAVGERGNSEYTNGASAAVSVTIFVSAYFLFLLLRRKGWRIGPPREGSSVFSLAQLLLATAFAAVALAVWTWTATDSQGRLLASSRSVHLMEVAGMVLVMFLVTLVFSLLVIPAIAIALGGRRRYALWLLGGLSVASPALVVGAFSGLSSLAPGILPVVLVFTTMWLFNAYRMCGYHFIGQPSPQRPRKRWFLAGVCLAVTGIVLSAWALRDFRAENAFNRPWQQIGVFPVSEDNSQLTSISFYRSGIGITQPGVEALKGEPLLHDINVECAATSEQIAWLLELRQVEVLMLSGKNKNDSHLESLYEADHLKRLELYDTSATVAEVKKLQEALPNCEVRMTNFAGKVIFGPPVKVQQGQVGTVIE